MSRCQFIEMKYIRDEWILVHVLNQKSIGPVLLVELIVKINGIICFSFYVLSVFYRSYINLFFFIRPDKQLIKYFHIIFFTNWIVTHDDFGFLSAIECMHNRAIRQRKLTYWNVISKKCLTIEIGYFMKIFFYINNNFFFIEFNFEWLFINSIISLNEIVN